jgi:hypothetical protein
MRQALGIRVVRAAVNGNDPIDVVQLVEEVQGGLRLHDLGRRADARHALYLATPARVDEVDLVEVLAGLGGQFCRLVGRAQVGIGQASRHAGEVAAMLLDFGAGDGLRRVARRVDHAGVDVRGIHALGIDPVAAEVRGAAGSARCRRRSRLAETRFGVVAAGRGQGHCSQQRRNGASGECLMFHVSGPCVRSTA